MHFQKSLGEVKSLVDFPQFRPLMLGPELFLLFCRSLDTGEERDGGRCVCVGGEQRVVLCGEKTPEAKTKLRAWYDLFLSRKMGQLHKGFL